MLAVWCLVIPALSAFVVGLPIRGLLARGKALDESAWVQVPFIGIAVTVLVLQLQVHLDVPVNRGALALGLLIALLWAFWLRTGAVKESLKAWPIPVFTVCTMIVVVQALGLFARGTDDYVGRSWSDQFNYTCMAECFRTQGFSFNLEDNYESAWLGRVGRLKMFRIGQSVLQAYHGVITRMPTRALFMPTMFLAFPLLALATYAIARRVGLARGASLIAAFFAGLVPGVTMLGQESFQSHVWGIPFLLMLPVILSEFNSERCAAPLITAALCMGALTSIYTEFLLFELAMLGGFLMLALVQLPLNARHLLGYVLLLAAPWLMNPLYPNINVFLYSPSLRQPGVLSHIYPWAYEGIGLGLIWYGDHFLGVAQGNAESVAILLGQAVVCAGMVGLVILALTGVVCWGRGRFRASAGGFDLRLALLGLALVPALMLAQGQEHPYQFYKLLLSVSPLHALGVVILGNYGALTVSRFLGSAGPLKYLATVTVWLPIVAAVSLATVGTARLAVRSADQHRTFRTSQHVALRSDFRTLRAQLESMRGHDILFQPPFVDRVYHQTWTLYFARHNRLWLTWPLHNDAFRFETLSLSHHNNLDTLPSRFLVLCSRDGSFYPPPANLPPSNIIWENAAHVLWQYDGRPWACVIEVHNPNRDEEQLHNGMWLGGGETALQVFASHGGAGSLRFRIHKGPCLDSSDTLHLLVTEPRGTSYLLDVTDGEMTLNVELVRGNNVLSLEVLNPKLFPAPGDPRPLLAWFQIQDLTLTPRIASIPLAGANDRD